METRNDAEKGLSEKERVALVAIAVIFGLLFVLWFSNYFFNTPLLGFGEVEGFGRNVEQTAGEPVMTWRIVPSLAGSAVRRSIEPPASASPVRIVSEMARGERSAVHLVSYSSDGQNVFGALGIPDGATSDGRTPAVVVCHPSDDGYTTGYHTLDTVKALADLGVIAFSTDYRGWGKSEGSRGNEVRDVWNALAALRQDPRVRQDRMGLIGFSMGGGIAARAAAADTGLALLVLYYPQMTGSVDELKDFLSFGGTNPGMSGVLALAQQGRNAGADDRELEYALRMISPIYHLDEFPGRIALFHAPDDQVVSVRQSEALAREMAAHGRRGGLETVGNLGHAFANSIENPTKERFLQIVREELLGG